MHRSTADQPLEREEDIVADAAPPPSPGLSRAGTLPGGLTVALAAACGVTAANLYYHQPLLAEMAVSFNSSVAAVGTVPMLTQVGYALGLLLIVPLGDLADRRKLVTALLACVTVALCATAVSPTLIWMAAFSLLVGVTTVVPQVLIPLAAQLAPPERRGKTVGKIMSGLLTGILLSRTVSGLVGHNLGWPAVFWMAAGLMVVVAFVLRGLLPDHVPAAHPMPYGALLRSIWSIVREHAVLRHAALNGAMMFACFSAFWVTLVFHLERIGYGAQTAGMFGLVGAVGALVAPLAGRLADRKGPRVIVTGAATLMAVSFGLLWVGRHGVVGLGAATLLLDIAATAGMIANQTRVYSLPQGIHSRANTVYMVSYFLGGAAGSYVGTLAWAARGWAGVCVAGAAISAMALLVHLQSGRRRAEAQVPAGTVTGQRAV